MSPSGIESLPDKARGDGAGRALLFAAVVGCVLLLSFLPAWDTVELKGFDLLSVASPPKWSEPPIVVVKIDEASFSEINGQWPWPRGLHARLIDSLKASGAAVIGVDLLFADPSEEAEDALLARSIRAAGNVVLAKDLEVERTGAYELAASVEPLEEFRAAAAAAGYVGIAVDGDMIVRRVPQGDEPFWRVVAARYLEVSLHAAPPALLPPDALMRHYGPAHTFKSVSYYQALAPAEMLPPDLLKNKIVLVGLDVKASPYGGGAPPDRFGTPFHRTGEELSSGAEIHATLIANALSGEFASPLPKGAELALSLGFLLLAFLWFRGWSPVAGVAKALCLLLLACGVSLALFAVWGAWWRFFGSLTGIGALYLVEGSRAYIGERRRKQEIRAVFQRYVSPEVVDQVLANPGEVRLGGERKELTVMFTDLAGFTSIAEEHEPEEVASFLNDYLTEHTRIIHAHGGTVDKFIGDAVMAFWGAPLGDQNHALHACEAAADLLQATEALRGRFAARNWPSLKVRVGINTGWVSVGNMGSEARVDYTVIGDAVNLASRLEGVNKLYGTEILASEATVKCAGGALPFRFVDRVRVKGKSQPISVYTLSRSGFPAELHEKAWKAYARGEWGEAGELWRELLAKEPEDPVAKAFLARIARLSETDARPGWDGVSDLEKC